MLSVEWPPVRNIFIPDPGWVFFDIDLAGADAQVVAWEANDDDLKTAFRNKLKIHVKNGCDIWGRDVMYSKDAGGKSEPFYTRVKRGVHLTNYGGQTSTLAIKCKMSQGESDKFQHTWFSLHPGIPEWHERTMFDIQTKGRTENAFGYGIDWFTRPSKDVWRQGLAWTPQSTVARVTEIGMVEIGKISRETKMRYNGRRVVKNAMQVHDSLVWGCRLDAVADIAPMVHARLHSIIVPYKDPLIIPWGIKRGRLSWGQSKEVTWESLWDEGSRGLVDRIPRVHGGHGSTGQLSYVDGISDSGGRGST